MKNILNNNDTLCLTEEINQTGRKLMMNSNLNP